MCIRSLNNHPEIQCHELRYKNLEALDWPCKPRPLPLAYNDSTHDLPGFDIFTRNMRKKNYLAKNKVNSVWFLVGYNIIDWSKSGKIAASFDRDLVLWGPPSTCNKNKTTVVYKLGHIKSLAFSHTGDQLALGVNEITSSGIFFFNF